MGEGGQCPGGSLCAFSLVTLYRIASESEYRVVWFMSVPLLYATQSGIKAKTWYIDDCCCVVLDEKAEIMLFRVDGPVAQSNFETLL